MNTLTGWFALKARRCWGCQARRWTATPFWEQVVFRFPTTFSCSCHNASWARIQYRLQPNAELIRRFLSSVFVCLLISLFTCSARGYCRVFFSLFEFPFFSKSIHVVAVHEWHACVWFFGKWNDILQKQLRQKWRRCGRVPRFCQPNWVACCCQRRWYHQGHTKLKLIWKF